MMLLFDIAPMRSTNEGLKKVDRNGRCLCVCVCVCLYPFCTSNNKHEIPLNIQNRMVSMAVHSFQFDFRHGYSGSSEQTETVNHLVGVHIEHYISIKCVRIFKCASVHVRWCACVFISFFDSRSNI